MNGKGGACVVVVGGMHRRRANFRRPRVHCYYPARLYAAGGLYSRKKRINTTSESQVVHEQITSLIF